MLFGVAEESAIGVAEAVIHSNLITIGVIDRGADLREIVRRVSEKDLDVAEYVWKNCCIGAKISACGILKHSEPMVWSCCFCAFTGSGLPAASQRN